MKGPSEIDNRFLVVSFLCVGLNGSVKLNFFFNYKKGILQVFPFGFEGFAIKGQAKILLLKLSQETKTHKTKL